MTNIRKECKLIAHELVHPTRSPLPLLNFIATVNQEISQSISLTTSTLLSSAFLILLTNRSTSFVSFVAI